MSEFKLSTEIVKLSESTDWDSAKLEWSLATVYEAEEPETCLCGHYPIIELCILTNTYNQHTATVGNCCVKKFMGLRSDKLFDAIKKIKKEPRKSVNSEMLLYAFRHGWLSLWEKDFYDDITRKRVLSYKQEGIKYKLNAKIIAGWNKKEKIIVPVKQYTKTFEDQNVEKLIN